MNSPPSIRGCSAKYWAMELSESVLPASTDVVVLDDIHDHIGAYMLKILLFYPGRNKYTPGQSARYTFTIAARI